jgi:hypothetical protein
MRNYPPGLTCNFLFFSTAPEHIAETDSAIRAIAANVFNIEIAHSLPEIIKNTYLARAFYVHAPDIPPFTDGFIQANNCSIPDYLLDIAHLRDMPRGEIACLILQHGAGDTLCVCLPQFV